MDDMMHFIETLRRAHRRWRRLALGAGAVIVVLLVVSLMQFLGTLMACRLLEEARKDAELSRQETNRALSRLDKANEALAETLSQAAAVEARNSKHAVAIEEAMNEKIESATEVHLKRVEDRLDDLKARCAAEEKRLEQLQARRQAEEGRQGTVVINGRTYPAR
jgi:hypothetical protein